MWPYMPYTHIPYTPVHTAYDDTQTGWGSTGRGLTTVAAAEEEEEEEEEEDGEAAKAAASQAEQVAAALWPAEEKVVPPKKYELPTVSAVLVAGGGRPAVPENKSRKCSGGRENDARQCSCRL